MKLDNINTTRTLGITLAVALCVIGAVHAQTQVQTQETRTQTGGTQAAATENSWTRLTDHDRLLAQIWGLTEEEMERAKVLLQGPRRSFGGEPFPHRSTRHSRPHRSGAAQVRRNVRPRFPPGR